MSCHAVAVDAQEQLLATDEDILMDSPPAWMKEIGGAETRPTTGDEDKMALRLKFNLKSSSYATMCIRELTKQSTNIGKQIAMDAAAKRQKAPAP